jgi:phosphonate transport system substrate-binding protein
MARGAFSTCFWVRAWALGLAALPLVLAAQTRTAAPVLSMGVVPVFSSAEIHKRAHPVAASLATACGQPVQLALSRSTAEFEAQLKKGKFDLVFLNSYHMVIAHKAQGYLPLVREGKQPFKGVLVVRDDSPVRHVSDLEGKTVAFPSPNAFAASLYMRALLEREHKVRVKVQYARTHSNSYRQVIVGEADAASGASYTLGIEPRHIAERLRVIYETPQIAPHPLAAHPRVPSAVRSCIQQTLLNAPPDSPLQTQLDQALIPNPVATTYARDYQPLEKLALESYVVSEPFTERKPL